LPGAVDHQISVGVLAIVLSCEAEITCGVPAAQAAVARIATAAEVVTTRLTECKNRLLSISSIPNPLRI